jgi:hypothetical protein
MKTNQLRVGDWVMVTGVPGEGIANYRIHRETARVFKKLIARKRPVRIREIDEFGQPWYECRFRKPDGTFELHSLGILRGEDNWVRVNRRTKTVRR